MEVIVAVGISAGTAYVISLMGERSLDRMVGAIARLVGGWRPDGLPHGVQEEDRDRPWGLVATALQGRATAAPPRPPLMPVRPSVRSR